MTRNPRDIHGDGHGFVDVPIGRRATREYRFNYNMAQMPVHSHPFLGLYNLDDGKTEARIVIRATPHRGFRLTSYENHHYLADPIGWAELPKP